MLPIKINSISKSFKKTKILDDISLKITSGETPNPIALNGTNKTTLIKIMLKLINEDAGSIEFFGINHTNDHSRNNLSYLPEKFTPSSFLTGHEFLELTLESYKMPYDKSAGYQFAEKLDLRSSALDESVSKYSKGMSQKLGLAAMLLRRPKLLILDEPMSGLDPRARVFLKNALKEYVAEGNTVFFTSHILADIDEICSKIAVIHNTKINFHGTPSEFRNNYPADSLEKSFLQSIAG
jgi:ABC-2 type transport system ATP-binding protein